MMERGGVQAIEREMPDAWIDALSVGGTPEDCASAIAHLGEAGTDAVVLVTPLDRPEERLETLARELLPVLGK